MTKPKLPIDSLPARAISTVAHPLIDFEPVARRTRHDGWSPQTQRAFLHALAECACVAEAARAVAMSPSSTYALRRRADARAFREAWDIALDYAFHRLSEAAFGRAMNGVATPVFFQGEQIGERRRYDERLTQFLLRHRDVRYATFPVGVAFDLPDPGIAFTKALSRVVAALPADGSPAPEVHGSQGDVV